MESLLPWGLGICFTGFCVLLAMMGKLNDKVECIKVDLEKRAPFAWIEEKLDKEFTLLNKSMSNVNDAIIGTIDKRGLLTAFHMHEDRIKSLENNVDKCEHCKKGQTYE
jgi:hypothetical protein